MRLIDADALRKCFEVPHELKCGIQAGMDEYALKCIDEQPTIALSPWHRVEEELPKKVGSYLTAYYDGFVCENQWHYIGPTAIGWVNDSEAVRYWMPLPEPPKEDA